MSKLAVATRVAWSFHGLPYMWGGDDPMEGFDCSGLCVEILKSPGILPRHGDWTAQGLYDYFVNQDKLVDSPYAGCLVFWNKSKTERRIVHVEFCISDELTIGASGGGSLTKDKDIASSQNAFIKVRPFRGRELIYGYVDPFLGE